MHQLLPATGRYGISVLAEDQEALSNHFAGRANGVTDIRFLNRLGVPLLEGAVAHFVCQIADIHPAGDHTLYIGRVEHFEASEGKPLLFYCGCYEQIREEKQDGVAQPQNTMSSTQ
jgi:flavin reductase (DIM6/NTAB) family NADH-FMN oxidoreductase RutF